MQIIVIATIIFLLGCLLGMFIALHTGADRPDCDSCPLIDCRGCLLRRAALSHCKGEVDAKISQAED